MPTTPGERTTRSKLCRVETKKEDERGRSFSKKNPPATGRIFIVEFLATREIDMDFVRASEHGFDIEYTDV